MFRTPSLADVDSSKSASSLMQGKTLFMNDIETCVLFRLQTVFRLTRVNTFHLGTNYSSAFVIHIVSHGKIHKS